MPFGPEISLIVALVVALAIAVLALAVVVAYRHGRAGADRAREAAEKETVALKRDIDNWSARATEYDKMKDKVIEAAKAGALGAAGELSSKLIEDSKRETEETQRKFHEQMKSIVSSVGVLAQQVEDNRHTMEIVRRALSSPGGAGQFAEITLENFLLSMGLEPERSFVLQRTVDDATTGARQRPDAMVFVPSNIVIVIDAKASKHLLEIAEAEERGEENLVERYDKLAKTMNAHLKGLSEKNYTDAVADWCRSSGRGKHSYVINIMFLQSDGAIERLNKADSRFVTKANAKKIWVVGPSGLNVLLAIAHLTIGAIRQEENQQNIIHELQTLLARLADALGHVDKVGRGIKQAADNFSRFVGSLNQRVLPSTRKIETLGVAPTGGKKLPSQIPRYHVTQDQDVIEGEAEELDEAPKISDQRGGKAAE